ncbi:hypothetical protein GCM10008938_49810 [Deinococcus roseus]|uniref:Uncharacterized protein n=1 Tax=Deinococcus roseus TaxID=392414 RepID=A0ABQ2DH18_9DEIO|nr:hypothetical protein GCM10008938_49810 [Deinococcus roseus]
MLPGVGIFELNVLINFNLAVGTGLVQDESVEGSHVPSLPFWWEIDRIQMHPAFPTVLTGKLDGSV